MCDLRMFISFIITLRLLLLLLGLLFATINDIGYYGWLLSLSHLDTSNVCLLDVFRQTKSCFSFNPASRP